MVLTYFQALQMTAFAASKWEYRLLVDVPELDGTQSKKNKISVEIVFSDGTDEGKKFTKTLQGTDKRGKEAGYLDWFEAGYAPWTLKSVTLKNNCTDGYYMHRIYIECRYGGKTTKVLEVYPGGNSSPNRGKWIDKNDGHDRSYSLPIDVKRNVSSAKSFDNLAKEVHLSIDSNSGSYYTTCEWNGTLEDQYSALGYNAWTCGGGNAPEIKVTASGYKQSGNVNAANFKAASESADKAGIIITEKGYRYNQKKLLEYMNTNKINEIKLDITLKVPKSYSISDYWEKTVTAVFRRDVFTFKNMALSGTDFTAGGNNYYNASGTDRIITVKATIDSVSNNYKHFANGFFNDCYFNFDDMYLQSGDLKIPIKKEAYYQISNGVVTFKFEYPQNADTKNQGLYLYIKNGRIWYGKTKYILWDGSYSYAEDASRYFKQYHSTYKIDAKVPTVTIGAQADTNLSKWNQKAVLSVGWSEDSYVSDRTQGLAMMSLVAKADSTQTTFLYGIESDDATKGNSSNAQEIPTVILPSSEKISISVPNGVEGEYRLKLEGEDVAGNKYSIVSDECLKLDRKAPEIIINNSEPLRDNDTGKMRVTSNVKLTDASETGRFYYMFTTKTKNEVAEQMLDEYESASLESGDITSKVDVLMYRDKNELYSEDGTTILFEVENDETFNGRMVYFAIDEAKNISSVGEKSVVMKNEDTTYSFAAEKVNGGRSYKIKINMKSDKNTVSYAWYRVNEERKKVYLYGENADGSIVYKDYAKNETIDTADDRATRDLNGEFYLEIKITTPTGSVLTAANNYVFDNEAPNVTVTVPSETSYAPSQLIYINIQDASGVSANGTTRRIVMPDGNEIEGMDEVALNVTDGSVSDYVRVSSLESGAYAVMVNATDVNGVSTQVLSEPFFIRNGIHGGEIEIAANLEYAELPLIGKDEDITVNLNITENFANLEKTTAPTQALYYRVSNVADNFGTWIKAGTLYSDANSFVGSFDISVSGFLYEDGALNELYIQTAICSDEIAEANVAASINSNNIRLDKLEFYYDESAPSVILAINDVHTNESVVGALYVQDNLDSPFTVSCDSNAVAIDSTDEYGRYTVTVSENVNTKVDVSDEAGNTQSVNLVIENIDTEAPTAEMTVAYADYGERIDATAELKVYGMVYATEVITLADEDDEDDAVVAADEDAADEDAADEDTAEENKTALANKPMFALIPEGTYTVGAHESGTIAKEYFKDNLSEDIFFEAQEVRSDNAKYDGEYDKTYNIKVGGVNGKWNIGIHVEDSLGNGADIVLEGTLETKYPEELIATASAKPLEAENISVVTVEFNRPVYALAQDKIVSSDYDDYDYEENPNYELCDTYAFEYSDKLTFKIRENGEYKLYTVDDLGKREFTSVAIDDVTFGASGELKYRIIDSDGNTIVDSEDDQSSGMICPSYTVGTTYYLEITPKEADTLMLPKEDYYVERWENGFVFEENRSWDEAVTSDGEPCETVYDEIFGYRKLYYQIEQIFDGYGGYEDINQRIITVQTFDISNDTGDTTEQLLLVDNIDNTAPKVSWTVSPNVLIAQHDDEGRTTWTKNPTPGTVTFTYTARDAESGIGKVLAIAYDGGEFYATPNEDGYWSWSGEDYPEAFIGYDEKDREIYGKIPVTIEYFEDSDDPFGVKTLVYTFTGEADLSHYATAGFTNCLGATAELYDDGLKMISTEGLIYSMPIEKDKDYTVSYSLSDGTPISESDIEENYYNNITATIEIPVGSRGDDRGLYIANNGGSTSVNLNSHQSVFTFDIKDKYGYGANETVELKNFDVTAGTLSYSIETTEKTNKDVKIVIVAEDDASGVGEVTLSTGKDNVEITLQEGATKNHREYEGFLTKNGMYNITMRDKSGNKTVANFNVTNINKERPEAIVTYAVADKSWIGDENEPKGFYTSRPVTASLSFSKTNVWIASVEPAEGGTLGKGDYSVNYADNSITFTKSGNLGVWIKDEYGNENGISVIVGVIDKTPPKVIPTIAYEKTNALVTFEKDIDSSIKNQNYSEKDIYVAYGGVVQTVADENGNKNSFKFVENDDYSFRVYDKEGLTSTVNITIDGIDKSAPKIVRASWSYEYYDSEAEKNVTVYDEITNPTAGTVGYRVATDNYHITNNDVKVEVETDSDTRILGGNGDYDKVKEKIYDANGFYMFDLEKENSKTASYGVDIQVIDKTPPVIELENGEMMFYEIPAMNKVEYSADLLTYEAYDVFGGEKTILTDKVTIDWGGFNYEDLYANTFDSSNPYTITYSVSDAANNVRTVTRTIRLVGKDDTLVLVNGELPDYSGRKIVSGDKATLSLANFSGTAYVQCMDGIKTMGEMKKSGVILEANENGEYELTYSQKGWITFYIQTDKRDYFTISVYAGA